ncbi:MAG TPA: PQQ-binding-like beta-propeller repeat protein [Clostridiaceae bacterium]|nr:PQQ-binding-like beta-propeller repeat protein [Clostridiaceae bacterium]
MQFKKSKILAFVLMLIMVFSFIPNNPSLAETENVPAGESGSTQTEASETGISNNLIESAEMSDESSQSVEVGEEFSQSADQTSESSESVSKPDSFSQSGEEIDEYSESVDMADESSESGKATAQSSEETGNQPIQTDNIDAENNADQTIQADPLVENNAVQAMNEAPQANPDEIKATLIVEGSKILETKADHDNAHEEWYKTTETIAPNTTIVDFVNDTLENAEIEIGLVMFGNWLHSIEVSDKPINISGETNGPSSSWMWYVKAKDAADDADYEMASSLIPNPEKYPDPKDDPAYVKAGDTIKLKFINDPRYPFNVPEQKPEAPLELKDDKDVVGWTGYRGDKQNKTPAREVAEIAQPTRELTWESVIEEKNEWGFPATISDLLNINGKTYYAAGDKLFCLNAEGQLIKTLKLAGSIEYFSRLTYSNGLIIVPLEGGAVQAIDADLMVSIWTVASIDKMEKWVPGENPEDDWTREFYKVQNLGTPFVVGDIVYVPITAIKGLDTAGGILRAINLKTGETEWQYQDDEAGYYWSGATEIGGYLIIGNDSGTLQVFDKQYAANKIYNPKETYLVGGQIRSTIVADGNNLYFTTKDGRFHSIVFDPATQTFSNHQAVQFAIAGTSTPTIYKGKAYVGGVGGDGGWGAPGVFAVINLADMKIEFKTEDLTGEVKSAPLILYDDSGEPYVYFTGNSDQGLLYVYHAGKVEIAYIPTADQANYTLATPIVDQNGNIFYTTDAGVIISLKSGSLTINYELQLNTEGKPQAISNINLTEIDQIGLLKHSLLKIKENTLYDDVITAALGDSNYFTFQTVFEGDLTGDPWVQLDLEINQELMPLAEDEEYKLYKLVGNSLQEVELNQAGSINNHNNFNIAPQGRTMMISPIFLTKLAGQLLPANQPKLSNLISFRQKLKDDSTYILTSAKVKVSDPIATDPSVTDPTDKDLKKVASNPDVKQISKTGEQSLMLPSALLLVAVMSLLFIRKKKTYDI